MFNLSEIIAKPVYCISDAKVLGTIENAVFDKKLSKIKYFSIFDDDCGDKRFLPVNRIMSIKNNSIIVKNAAFYENAVNQNSPLRAEIYNYEGSKIGVVTDILINDDFSIKNLQNNNRNTIDNDNVISFSNYAVLICNDSEKLKVLKKIKPYKKSVNKITKTENKKILPQKNNNTIHLRNIVPEYNYLIGRKAEINIYSDNKDLLIKQNNYITKNVIDLCRKHNKLMILAKNSKYDF